MKLEGFLEYIEVNGKDVYSPNQKSMMYILMLNYSHH